MNGIAKFWNNFLLPELFISFLIKEVKKVRNKKSKIRVKKLTKRENIVQEL